MKLKKSLICAIICLTLSVSVFALSACNTELGDLNVDTDYKKFDISDEYTAYDMLQTLYSQWTKDSFYREETFHFEANAVGMSGIRDVTMINKVTPQYVYYQQLTYGTGLAAANEAERFYYGTDGTQKGIVIENNVKYNDKTKEFSMKKDWSAWGDYGKITPIAERAQSARAHLTTYVFDTRDCLAKEHEEAVYYDKTSGTYYFTITFDCSTDKMNTLQTAARDEFIESTGAENEGFQMQQNTTLQVRARKVDGVLRMIYFCRTEKYSGKKKIGVSIDVKAQQQCISIFDYDSAKYALSGDEKI